MTRSRAPAPPALLLLAALAAAPPSSAQEVTAVLSPAPGPYQAAYDGFVAALGQKVAAVRLPGGLPAADSRTRVYVTFGGEAAVQSYPETATLIACLAPGLSSRLRHAGPFVFVTMRPAPQRLLSELRRLQPDLKRLGVLSNHRALESYIADLKLAGEGLGIEIIAPEASGPDKVPDALRALVAGKADAVWLAPDPSLVTPANFQTIKQFSWDNRLPFYAPTRGLAAAGASAAVSVSAREAGRLAAELARRVLAGETVPKLVYPERTELTVNETSALKAGLTISAKSLGADVEVIP